MFPVRDFGDRDVCPWSSELLLCTSNDVFLVDVHVIAVGLILHLERSETLDNELLVDGRVFGLICSHDG